MPWPWYGRFWPLDAQLKYRLASTHYRRDQPGMAAARFGEAAGPWAMGPFRELHAFAEQMMLFGNDAAYAVEGPEETRVAFLATDPLPVIEVWVNGQGSLNFLIDTGGAELILDRELARRVGAQLCGSIRADYAGKKIAETGLGKVDAVKLGEVIVRNVPIHALDTKAMSKVFNGTEIHGILGTRALMHFLSTIDYVNGALILCRPNSSPSQNATARSDAAVVPFWLVEMHCMVAWGNINDQEPLLFFVDTGLAGAGFTASEAVLRQAGIAVDWNTAQTGIGGAGDVKQVDFTVDRLSLGTGSNAVVETNVRGIAIAGGVSILEGKLGIDVSGLISHQFFRKRALTLDFKAMRLILQ